MGLISFLSNLFCKCRCSGVQEEDDNQDSYYNEYYRNINGDRFVAPTYDAIDEFLNMPDTPQASTPITIEIQHNNMQQVNNANSFPHEPTIMNILQLQGLGYQLQDHHLCASSFGQYHSI